MHVSPLLANLEEVPRSWQGMGNQLRNKLSNKERKKERKKSKFGNPAQFCKLSTLILDVNVSFNLLLQLTHC